MKNLKSLLGALTFVLMAQMSFGQSATFKNAENVALNGYDVVSYHTQYEAVRGNVDNSTTIDGTIYYFSSAENLKTFKEKPSSYLPQYGGYCAFAMAKQGAKFPVDPATFKIRDGKLYLFYNDFYEGKPFNTIVPWNGEEADLIGKADVNWGKEGK